MAPFDFFDHSDITNEKLASRSIPELALEYRERKNKVHPRTKILGTDGDQRYGILTLFFAYLDSARQDPTRLNDLMIRRYLDFLQLPAHPDHSGACIPQCKRLPYKASTARRHLDVLRDFYELATSRGLTSANPTVDVEVDVPGREDIEILTKAEADHIWHTAKWQGPRDATVVGLLLGMGLRLEEATFASIGPTGPGGEGGLGRNELGPTLEFWRAKRREWHTLNIPDPVWEVLRQQTAGRSEGRILTMARRVRSKSGDLELSGLSPRGVEKVFKSIGQSSGVRDDLYPHLARHTAITYARTLRDRHGTILSRDITMTHFGHVNAKDHHRYDAYVGRNFISELINPACPKNYAGWHLDLAA